MILSSFTTSRVRFVVVLVIRFFAVVSKRACGCVNVLMCVYVCVCVGVSYFISKNVKSMLII